MEELLKLKHSLLSYREDLRRDKHKCSEREQYRLAACLYEREKAISTAIEMVDVQLGELWKP